MTTQIPIFPGPERLVIVDPQLDDYRCLYEPAQKHLVQLTTTSTGSNALRLVPSFADAVWLLSPQLPDMDGLDLLEMIHSLSRLRKAVVIDNHYDPQREQRALELQAIQYVCKPMQWSWLSAWQGVLTNTQEIDMLYQRPNDTQFST
ncbi:MAG: response regulator [Pirellulales bacterium]